MHWLRPIVVLIAFSALTEAAEAADLTARGIDLFILTPHSERPGAKLPLLVRAYGFPEVTKAVPLPSAIVEAVWEPSTAGADLPPVSATTDASGSAMLEVPVPGGGKEPLALLVSVRAGSRQRTRELKVERRRPRELQLYVGDTRVVPGSIVPVWAQQLTTASGVPVDDAPILLELLEGGVSRWRREQRSDAAGGALFRVPIPIVEEPDWRWTLRARSLEGEELSAEATVELSVRDETPATPSLTALIQEYQLLPGEEAHLEVIIQDASGRSLADTPFTYWVGSRGAEPKSDEEWKKRAQLAETGSEGFWRGAHRTPTTVGLRGASLFFRARAEVDGHVLHQSAELTLGRNSPTVELWPEANALVPGVRQRLLLRVIDAKGAPVRGRFALAGDGLSAEVSTDEHGEAELTWNVPKDVGARHDAGPCAESVAATVQVGARGGGALHEEISLARCVPVDRTNGHLLVVDPPVVRAGEAVHLRVLGAGHRNVHLLAESLRGGPSFGTHVADGEAGGALVIPPEARGLVQFSAVAPGAKGAPARAAVLALPPVLPSLSARLVGGRLEPGGFAEIEAVLTDEHDAPLSGTVVGAVIDAFGGGHAGGWQALDTRTSLTSRLELGPEGTSRTTDLLLGDRRHDPLRRAALGATLGPATVAERDPAAQATAEFSSAFAQVVRALEGEVFFASEDPERRADVFRKTARGFELNPELLSLVTAELDPPATTPGGEPVMLQDLLALDPQVRFENVAKRVTRLKMFRVLQALRDLVFELRLTPEEPAMRAPRVLLGRLVREGRLSESSLVDAFGQAFRLVEKAGPRVPFLGVVRGFRLTSAGPDGIFGSRDDLDDPFERVLRTETPYARAVEEDRLVDAQFELVVGNDTVEAWSELFERLTGHGELSGGEGSGMGYGGLGTLGGGGGGQVVVRSVAARATPPASWVPPVRIDATGRVRLRVPLGPLETTWRVVLLATPDHATPAVASVDVPVKLPLAIRADAGSGWVNGDEVEVQVKLHNHTDRLRRISFSARASGAAVLEGQAGQGPFEVSAGQAASVAVRVRAKRPGEAKLSFEARSDPELKDDLALTLMVRRAGQEMLVSESAWVEGEGELRVVVEPGHEVIGPARALLAFELEPLLSAALEAVAPDRQLRDQDRALALEAAGRIAEVAKARSWLRLHTQAKAIIAEAQGRLLASAGRKGRTLDPKISPRLNRWGFVEPGDAKAEPAPTCPPANVGETEALELIALEPPPRAGVVSACWDSLAAEVGVRLGPAAGPDPLARAALAFVERPHRRTLAKVALARLIEKTHPEAAALVLPADQASDRGIRSLVLAALILGQDTTPSSLDRGKLLVRLLAEQETTGSFGSAEATLAAVRAILSTPLTAQAPSEVIVEAPGLRPLVLTEASALTLEGRTRSVRITTQGGGVLARLSIPVLRPWSLEPSAVSPLHGEITWPEAPLPNRKEVVRIAVRHELPYNTEVELVLPLPAGAELAERVGQLAVRQAAGALRLRLSVPAGSVETVLELPIRFRLPGRLTAPEGQLRVPGQLISPGVLPARMLVVRTKSNLW